MTRQLLEYLLFNCTILEVVCVRGSQSLVGAIVVPASPKLKYLEISDCDSVEFLIISAINLWTFKYAGPRARLSFTNVPNLVDVSFGGPFCQDIVWKFQTQFIPLSQIEKLTLDMGRCDCESFDEFPELTNLKQLELVLRGWDRRGGLHYATLVEKCPMLYRLCVQFKWWLEGPLEIKIEEKECRLECLKFVEIFGFRGSRTDVELATCLVTNAPNLEKITIDTRDPPHFTGTLLELFQEEKVAAKELVRQHLSTKLSPSVEFLIL